MAEKRSHFKIATANPTSEPQPKKPHFLLSPMSEQEHRLPSSSSSSSSSEIYSTMRAILTGSLSLSSLRTGQVMNILKDCIMEARRRLHRMEIELAKLKQELNDERKARERAEALVMEVSADAQHKLISTEAEFEAMRRLLEEEREKFNTIHSEASERQKEAVVAHKTSLQELDKERQSRALAEIYAREVAAKSHEEVVEAMKQASLSIHKLGAAEAELQATRRALAEEKERCEQIRSEASEKQREAVVAQRTSFQELARAEASARAAEEEIAQATENARRAEVELEASRQALYEERERCKRIQTEASEKLEEALIAQKTNLKELEGERQARALAVKQANLSAKLSSAAEAELEATCQALAEERERSKRIQNEASKTQSKLLLCLENDVKELNEERKARAYAETCAREAAAKARDEIAEAVRQSSSAAQKFVAAEAELEATRRILAEERQRYQKIQFEACEKQKEALLAQRTAFLKQLKAQVDTAEKALH